MKSRSFCPRATPRRPRSPGAIPEPTSPPLRFSASGVGKAQLAPLQDLKVGHVVLAIGRRPKSGVTASYGIVSAIGEGFRTWSGGRIDVGLRLDLSPYRGFSGGTLIDSQGRVIGINTSGPHRSVLTIPNTTVDRVVTQLLEKGHIARGYIGVGVQPVEIGEAMQRSAGVKQDAGLLLLMVSPGGPAEKAGTPRRRHSAYGERYSGFGSARIASRARF